MNNDRNAFIAGLFILISIVLAGFLISGIKGTARMISPNEPRKITYTLSDNLSGLAQGDDVRLGGYKVGTVRSIEVSTDNTPDSEPRIIVTISLPSRYQLHADARVVVDSSLTGVPYVNIERLGSGSVTDAIVGQPSTFTQVLALLQTQSPRAVALLGALTDKTVPKIDAAADSAGQALGQMRDLLSDSRSDVRGTLASLHSSLDTIHQKLPDILDLLQVDLKKVQSSLDHAQGALGDLTDSLANAKDVTGSLRSLLTSNRSKLDGIIGGLKTTSDNLKGASVEIRQSPWRLLYKPAPEEMGNLNLFDSARQFADGAASLDDAATALRDAINDPHTDPATAQKLLKNLQNSFDNFKQVEDKLWSQVKQP